MCQQELYQDIHKKCNSVNNDRINTHDIVENVLYGYVCIQCKFIQLSKDNVKKHLDREHQQINFNDENIVEIKLLKISSNKYLFAAVDSKFEEELIKAKRLNEAIQDDKHDPDPDSIMIAHDMADDMVDDSNDGDNVMIDLTLSDEE